MSVYVLGCLLKYLLKRPEVKIVEQTSVKIQMFTKRLARSLCNTALCIAAYPDRTALSDELKYREVVLVCRQNAKTKISTVILILLRY